MQDVSFTDQDYRLCVLLHQTRDAINRARNKELCRFGISTIQAAVLFIIKAIGEQATPAEISRWLLQEPHSVSGLLSRMEKEGLLKKTKGLDRKNMWRVCLTEKGQNAYRQSIKRESIHTAMSPLSANEHQQFESYLRKVRDQTLRNPVSEKTFPFP